MTAANAPCLSLDKALDGKAHKTFLAKPQMSLALMALSSAQAAGGGAAVHKERECFRAKDQPDRLCMGMGAAWVSLSTW